MVIGVALALLQGWLPHNKYRYSAHIACAWSTIFLVCALSRARSKIFSLKKENRIKVVFICNSMYAIGAS